MKQLVKKRSKRRHEINKNIKMKNLSARKILGWKPSWKPISKHLSLFRNFYDLIDFYALQNFYTSLVNKLREGFTRNKRYINWNKVNYSLCLKTYFSTTSGLAFARDAINNFPNDAIKFLMKYVQVIMNIKK